MNFIAIARQAAWYNYLVVAALVPIGLVVFYKIFIRYKVLRLGNNMVQLDFPMLRQSKKYKLDEVALWAETKVKTGKNTEYKELTIRFVDGKKINVSHKEHTEYARLVQYFSQKLPKKKAVIG